MDKSKCKADRYALWCDACNSHPNACKLTLDEKPLLSMSFEKIELKPLDDDWEPPSYNEKGSILVHVGPVYLLQGMATREYEVIDHDGCTFWIEEGEGFDYWLDQIDWPERGGYFYITNITGRYHRGDGYSTDDDVDWDYDPPRRVYWWWRLWQWIRGRMIP